MAFRFVESRSTHPFAILTSDHPSKIHFRFYAVDDDKVRTEICPISGLVLIPKQVVARLQNDDQLAAILADGIAYNMQRQAARVAADNRILLSVGVAADVVGTVVPGLGVAALLAGNSAASKINLQLGEERARIALELLADAQYDPHQAPEAWRLLAPQTLRQRPGNPSLPRVQRLPAQHPQPAIPHRRAECRAFRRAGHSLTASNADAPG